MALNYYKKLYVIEHYIQDLSPNECYRMCLEKSVSVLKQFKAWIDMYLQPQKALSLATTFCSPTFSGLMLQHA
jgi:hypothetical protein